MLPRLKWIVIESVKKRNQDRNRASLIIFIFIDRQGVLKSMRVIIQDNYDKLSKWAANYIAEKINAHKEERPFILGLPTGSSPRNELVLPCMGITSFPLPKI